VANAIEAIAIYEMKTNLAHKSMSQTKRQEEKVAENASNKRKWGSNYNESLSQQNKRHKVPGAHTAWPINKKAQAGSLPLCNQCKSHHKNASNKRKWESNHNGNLSQQNKGHKVPRAHTAWPINKKAYVGSLPLCNQCKIHHNGPCIVKCGNCKKVGHIIQNCRTPATAKNQRTHTCYECGSMRHYKSECPIVMFHERVDMIHGRVRASKPKTMQDAIEIATKLMNKKISTLVECQTQNKKRLDNTAKNNQNQQ
nr:reverse transcriptase domain-containing protein [Tanacetum cinerariifolium]